LLRPPPSPTLFPYTTLFRSGPAKELHDLLESLGVSVWFSEKDVVLGSPLLREIDKGLAKSRVGIVLVTPALLRRLQGEGLAELVDRKSTRLNSSHVEISYAV